VLYSAPGRVGPFRTGGDALGGSLGRTIARVHLVPAWGSSPPIVANLTVCSLSDFLRTELVLPTRADHEHSEDFGQVCELFERRHVASKCTVSAVPQHPALLAAENP